MTLRHLLLALTLTVWTVTAEAADDYKQDAQYLTLRDSMHHAFNDGDSTRFFTHLKALQDYLLAQNDLHAYYTQRCNEIIFLMNRQKIFEAYKLARELSKELREKKLDKEMYMAYNMLGHINRICGNRETAKECFYEVIRRMEKEGYYESMPPIYMNIVNVEMGDNPEEAEELLEKAKKISEKYSPERVFDIETRKTVSYYNRGDIPRFLEGYKAYRQGVEEGKSSVHGRTMEIYYLASQGKIDEAVAMARKDLGDDGDDIITLIYEKAGRWQEAYEALRKEYNANDSINNVVLTNSLQGIRDELTIYEADHKTAKMRVMALAATIALLLTLLFALVYIMFSHRRHMRQLNKAYQHALESDQMKTAFIQNVSHEIRTPLNIISGFSQVIADPSLTNSAEERQHMSKMMQKSAVQVTTLIDEILSLSLIESTAVLHLEDRVAVNSLLRNVSQEYESLLNSDTTIRVESSLPDDFLLTTNRNMLNRVVSSLVDNAVKNTQQGSITISADRQPPTEEGLSPLLTISVTDTGTGVPEGEEERIFERFVKLDNFKEGIGLGLTIARRLTEKLGGSVALDRSYHQGARFVLTLPTER